MDFGLFEEAFETSNFGRVLDWFFMNISISISGIGVLGIGSKYEPRFFQACDLLVHSANRGFSW